AISLGSDAHSPAALAHGFPNASTIAAASGKPWASAAGVWASLTAGPLRPDRPPTAGTESALASAVPRILDGRAPTRSPAPRDGTTPTPHRAPQREHSAPTRSTDEEVRCAPCARRRPGPGWNGRTSRSPAAGPGT